MSLSQLRWTLGVILIALAVVALPLLGQQGAAKKHALLVGVNVYQHEKLPELKYAVNDVTELHKILKTAHYDVTLLTDAQATKAVIERELKAVLGRCQKGDGGGACDAQGR